LYNVTFSLYIKYRSWNHVVGIENKLPARRSLVRIPAGLKFISSFPLPNTPHPVWGPTSFLRN